MYKESKVLQAPLSTELFKPRKEQHHNLRKNTEFTIPVLRTVYHGSESISLLGPKIWIALPDRLKNPNSLETFKLKIKKWKPENCPFGLCRL